MVVDTSAIIAILFSEPEQQKFIEDIKNSEFRMLSSASFLEASIVILQRFGEEGFTYLDLFIVKSKIEIKPVDSSQIHIARQAYVEFGKNRHPANLNFGDCLAYALSKLVGQPLLFKGNDFSKTDVPKYEVM